MLTIKSLKRPLALALLGAACLLLPVVAVAQVTPADGNTAVYDAPNGVPIVDIANPNAAGLSHNRFNKYNVDSKGLILNNGDHTQLSRASQLAGQVPANLNLSKEADVILNEVVMPNRSSLAGYTELVGKQADVILANPYGITCNGCGFINIPNMTLTTGAPQISGGGALTGFRTEDGDILITGAGLDGEKTDYLALVARSVAVNAQVNAKYLHVVGGGSDFDYVTKTATAHAGTGAAPVYAIDSSALGGMYADRIRLVVTEAGAGVRMRAEAAAGADDFTLDSSGKISLNAKVSADKDVKITSSASGADAIQVNDVTISAHHDTQLNATAGEVHLLGGVLTAGRDLSITSDSLNDEATSTPGADTNKRYAGHDLGLTQTGAAALNGVIYGAGSALTGAFDTLTVGADGLTAYGTSIGLTTAGDMQLKTAQLQSATGDLSLTSTGGAISTLSGAKVKSTGGDIFLTAHNGLTNPATIAADNGDVTFRVNGTLNNSGTVYAKNNVDMADEANGATETFTNSGTLIADAALALKAATLNNNGSGKIQGGSGANAVTVTGTLTNASGATLTAAGAAGSGTVNAGTISNSGLLQSLNTLALNIGAAINNLAGAKIFSTGDMTVRGLTAGSYTVTNNGIIQSDNGLLDIKGNGGSNAVTLTGTTGAAYYMGQNVDIKTSSLTLANSSSVTAENDLTLNAAALTFSGSAAKLIAARDASITMTNAMNNTAIMHAGRNLTLSAPSISNSSTGGISAAGTITGSATAGNFTNNGAIFGATNTGSSITLSSTGTFTNSSTGTIDSDHDASITASTFTNSNDIRVANNLTITATTFHNDVAGGDTRVWSYAGSGFDPSDGGLTGDQDDHTGADEGDHSKMLNWTYTRFDQNDPDDDGGDITARRSVTFDTKLDFAAGTTPTHKPQLLAGNQLIIKNFTSGTNVGGVISAGTVKLQGLGGTFTNNDLATITQHWYAEWNHYQDCESIFRFDCDGWIYYRSYEKNITGTVQDNTIGAGIFAGSIQMTGPFTFTNAGSTATYAGGAKSATTSPGATPTGAAGTSGSGTVTFGGATITLPINPNGFFIVSQDPNSHYLIETNPLFTNGNFLSSDYMAERFGVDVDTLQRRLGDGNYEAYLIRQQLVAQIGSNVIVPGDDEAAQMQHLMDNGVEQGKALGLTYGKAPTSEQLAGLKDDMVWMVETEVNGEKVLAPVVYLSDATKSMISKGAVLAGNHVSMDIDSVVNNGGTIKGTEDLNITTRGDITNLSGKIQGGDVSLKSTEGSIVNKTYATEGDTNAAYHRTDIGKSAGIEATGNLNVDAKKDIYNKGATMSAGGDANLNAGDNITFDTIEDKKRDTTIGEKISGFFGFGGSSSETTESSTTQVKSGLTVGGNLKTKSGKDTTFAGTDVTVGGDADLETGGNLNILSREDSHSTSTHTKSGNAISGHEKTTTETTTTNVGSKFKVGGNLKTDSKGDTTIQGSDIDVAGDGDMHAGGNFKVLDGKNTTTTSSQESKSGLGVGGGVYGAETETDTHYQSKSVGSNLKFGGNGNLSSDKTLTIQGSNVEAGGDLGLKGKDVKILEGRDIDESHHTKTTTTFLSIGSDDEDDAPQEEAQDEDETEHDASASAEAEADTSASGKGDLSLSKTTTVQTDEYSSKAKGSNIKSGGNMKIESENDTTIRGSNVEAGGDVDLSGKNINIEAAEDTHTKTTKKTETSIGLHASSDNEAHAGAKASAYADQGGASADGHAGGSGGGANVNAGDASAGAEASAEAGASTDNTLDVMRHTETTTTTTDITHTGSTIKSGGNMKVKADNTLNVKGSDMEAGGDADLKAKDMNFEAVNDSHTTTTSTSKTKVGLYAEGSANADASAGANAGAKEGVSGEAGASADAEAGVGLYGTNTTSTSTEGYTKAKTSTIKSGGNMTREAEGKITDEGTQIEAGGDFTQKSKEWESKAEKDTTFSSSSSETNTAKLGLYGEANAGASASGEAAIGQPSTDTGADAGASAGLKASYNRNTSDETSNTSSAVTSSIKSGGKMKTTTEGKTSLEGTNLESGGDMELNAGSLDYKAAKDTASSSKSSDRANGEIKVGVDATKAVTGSLSGGYGEDSESESSSTAVTGSMKSGGKLKVNTKDDARFEGTNIESEDDASIKAGGNVTFDAAHDEKSSTKDSMNVDASISASKGGKGGGGKSSGGKGSTGMGINASGGFEHETSSSSDAVTGSIKSGGKLDISAGKNATFEGTDLDSKGDMGVEAGGDVNFNAAKSTSSSESYGMDAELSLSKGGKDDKGKTKGTEAGLSAEGNYSKSDETTSKGSGLKSGGKLTVKSGNDVNMEGTNIESEGKTKIDAKGDVNMKAAEDKKDSISVDAGVTLGKKTAAKGGDKSENESTVDVSAKVEGEKSSTKKAGSIKAGEIEINAGDDATFEGTNLESKGDTSVKAGGDVNFNAAESSHVDGSFNGSLGTSGASLKDAGIGGGVDRQGSTIKSGGDLKVESGGKTTFTGTQADVEGKADVKAGGGVEENSAVSGGAQLGTSRAGVNVDVQKTQINAKGGYNK